MSKLPFEPLRWYEDFALYLLSRSPRIAAITVKLPIIEPEPEPLADRKQVDYLEDLWKKSDPPSDTRMG